MDIQTFIMNILSGVGINDVLDILITTFVLYKVMEFIKETRAQQLMKGLLVLIVLYFLSGFLNLSVIHWFLGGTFTIGVFALVVLFQPELRRGLEVIGRSKLVKGKIVQQVEKENAKHVCDEIAAAVADFSASKVGALIVFEQEIALKDIAEKGTLIDAEISAQLLGNLFYEGSPLHDGAVIIRGERIYAAGCVLPLSENSQLNKSLGTRHRAGIGITENSDALALMVSEETGIISTARDGKITRFLDKKGVEKTLFQMYMKDEFQRTSPLVRISNRIGRGNHASE